MSECSSSDMGTCYDFSPWGHGHNTLTCKHTHTYTHIYARMHTHTHTYTHTNMMSLIVLPALNSFGHRGGRWENLQLTQSLVAEQLQYILRLCYSVAGRQPQPGRCPGGGYRKGPPIIMITIMIHWKVPFKIFKISSLHCRLFQTCTLKWPGHNHVQITCSTLSDYYMQHVLCHVIWKDSSAIKFDKVFIASNLALFYWLNKRLANMIICKKRSYINFKQMLKKCKYKLSCPFEPSLQVLAVC